jgi:cell wall assembly regulator SMI1
MKTLTLTATLLFSLSAQAFTFPDQLWVKPGLLCTVMDSSGKYFCQDQPPSQPGQSGDVLILSFDELVKLKAQPVTQKVAKK